MHVVHVHAHVWRERVDLRRAATVRDPAQQQQQSTTQQQQFDQQTWSAAGVPPANGSTKASGEATSAHRTARPGVRFFCSFASDLARSRDAARGVSGSRVVHGCLRVACARVIVIVICCRLCPCRAPCLASPTQRSMPTHRTDQKNKNKKKTQRNNEQTNKRNIRGPYRHALG